MAKYLKLTGGRIKVLSSEEGYKMVDELAHRYLNMSAAEFI